MISVVVHPGSISGPYSLQLANALTKYARVAYVLDTRSNNKYYKNTLVKEIEPLKFKKPRIREMSGFIEMYILSKKIRRFKPDIIHFQGNGIWESVLLRFLRKYLVINTVHDPIKHIDYRKALNIWTMKDMIKKSSGIVVHSNGLKKILQNYNTVDSSKILVHPHGLFDYYRKFSSQVKKREKTMLFFGNFRYNKGPDLLLKSFENIKDDIPDWRLVMAGQVAKVSHKSLSSKIKKAVVGSEGLSNEIVLKYKESLGNQIDVKNRFIEDDEVWELFSTAGIVVLPYRHGSQSGVLAIAAAFGCPVLATKVGALPELLVNEKHALLVQPESIEALQYGLVRMAGDDKLRDKMGTQLLELGEKEWSWDVIASGTIGFYNRMLNQPILR